MKKELIAAQNREFSFLDHIKTLETNDVETQNEFDAAKNQISQLNSSLSSCLEKVANHSKESIEQQIELQRCEEKTGLLRSQIDNLQK